jgi:hypothetical protein
MKQRKGVTLAEALVVYGDRTDVETWRRARDPVKYFCRMQLADTFLRRWNSGEVRVVGFWSDAPDRVVDIPTVPDLDIDIEGNTVREKASGRVASGLHVLAVARSGDAKPRRGPLPVKTQQAVVALKAQLASGKLTTHKLQALTQEALARRLKVSRGTAARARQIVLSEFARV